MPADASAALEKALAVNPSSLEALSLQAAMAFLDDRTADFDTLAAKVLAINPRYGEVYRVAGAEAARHYRFDAAVELTRKALALDPGNVRASAELGAHLLRTGDEPSARASLDRAFKADPYDVVSYNLLGLLDSLDSFQTLQDGLVTMRLHPDEASVLRSMRCRWRATRWPRSARAITSRRKARSDRDLPPSRRLRRAQRRPARHDRRARRVLRRGPTRGSGSHGQQGRNARVAVLGLLHDSPLHGYELRKRLNLLLGWTRLLSYGSLYPA